MPVKVIAWRIVSEMTYNVSSGTLSLTHSLTQTEKKSLNMEILLELEDR